MAGRPKGSKNTKLQKDKKNEIKTCSMQISEKCKKDHEDNGGRKSTEFYMVINKNLFKSEKIHVCKDCIKDYIYKPNGEIDLSKFKKILQIIDIPFFKKEFDSAVESKNETFGDYHKNIALNHIGKCYEDGDKDTLTVAIDVSHYNETPTYNEEWGGTFTGSQIKTLNKYFEDLKDDFNIITTNHRDYARKVAKASLLVDIEYDKLMRGDGSLKAYKDAKEIFDTLCNSAKFAESRRGKTSVSNGITDIVESVEGKSWIYEKSEFEKDDLDCLLDQFKNIEKSL